MEPKVAFEKIHNYFDLEQYRKARRECRRLIGKSVGMKIDHPQHARSFQVAPDNRVPWVVVIFRVRVIVAERPAWLRPGR